MQIKIFRLPLGIANYYIFFLSIFYRFQAELYVNLMDEDSGDYSDDKVDEYDVEQSIDDLGTIAIDLTEDDPVKINPKTSYDMCNNNGKKLSDFKSGETNSNITLEKTCVKSVIYDDNPDDEENGDIVAKLLDPFEQLEREFNWDEVAAIKPPSAFSSGQQGSGPIDSRSKISQFSKNTQDNIPPNRRTAADRVIDSSQLKSYNQVYTNSTPRR